MPSTAIPADPVITPRTAGRFFPSLGPLGVSSVLLAVLIGIPIAVVVGQVFLPSTDTWAHLASTVLAGYIRNTLYLLVGVAAGVLAIGTTTAWLVTTYRFPGRRFLEWALVLPLAMPVYVTAYAYADALQFAGPVQTWLRETMNWKTRGDYWFPDIRSVGGAIALFSLTLYPYVYLVSRTAFLEQSLSTLEVSQLFGVSRAKSFFRIALPLARPAVVAGTALALMETLADFGTVSYLAVQTFTTGIYRVWFSLGDSRAAAQLSAVLLVFVVAILAFEQGLRGRARVHNSASQRKMTSFALTGWRAWGAAMWCLLPVMLGFLIPAGILLRLAVGDGDPQFGPRFLGLVTNSFTLAGIAALVAVTFALIIGYAARTAKHVLVRYAAKVAGLGYAFPGSVIAVGILVPLTVLDNALAQWAKTQFGVSLGLLLTGSIAALIYAYTVRFLGIALQAVNAGLAKITLSMDDAARSLGSTPLAALRRVHFPMLRGSLATAALIVFVDVMKELPATFVMRPFNFDTLAVQVFNLASDERLSEAATASLVIVVVGLLPLILLSHAIRKTRRE